VIRFCRRIRCSRSIIGSSLWSYEGIGIVCMESGYYIIRVMGRWERIETLLERIACNGNSLLDGFVDVWPVFFRWLQSGNNWLSAIMEAYLLLFSHITVSNKPVQHILVLSYHYGQRELMLVSIFVLGKDDRSREEIRRKLSHLVFSIRVVFKMYLIRSPICFKLKGVFEPWNEQTL